jgi:hypothetical protein
MGSMGSMVGADLACARSTSERYIRLVLKMIAP